MFLQNLLVEVFQNPYVFALTLILATLTYYIHYDSSSKAGQSSTSSADLRAEPEAAAAGRKDELTASADKEEESGRQKSSASKSVADDGGKREGEDEEDKFVRLERERVKKDPSLPVPPPTPLTPLSTPKSQVGDEFAPLLVLPSALLYGLTLGSVDLFRSPTIPKAIEDAKDASAPLQ